MIPSESTSSRRLEASIDIVPSGRVSEPRASADAPVMVETITDDRSSKGYGLASIRRRRGSAIEPSAEERLAADPVADHVDRVQVAGVPGGMQDARAARRRALPGPPPILLVQRR